jgi:hypothetical protein
LSFEFPCFFRRQLATLNPLVDPVLLVSFLCWMPRSLSAAKAGATANIQAIPSCENHGDDLFHNNSFTILL